MLSSEPLQLLDHLPAHVFCAKGYQIAEVFSPQKVPIIHHDLILKQQKKKICPSSRNRKGGGETEKSVLATANFLWEKHRLLNDIRQVISLYYGMRFS